MSIQSARWMLLLAWTIGPWVHAQGILDEWASVPPPPAPPLSRVSLEPRTTALLVLDVSSHTCNEAVRPRCVRMLPRVQQMLKHARAKGLHVVYALGVLPVPGSPVDVLPEAAMLGTEPWVRSGPDKFLQTDLEDNLRAHGIKTVIALGTASHGAVLHTASEAVFRGFKVVIPVDAVAGESLFGEQYTLWHLQNAPRMPGKVTLSKVDWID